MSPLEKRISDLAKATKELNSSTETVNALLKAADERLASMNVGIAVWDDSCFGTERESLDDEPIDDDRDDRGGDLRISTGWELGYAKVRDEWRLVVRRLRISDTYFEGQPNSLMHDVAPLGELVPVLEAPRAIRIQALARLESLIESMTECVNSLVAEIKQARELASD